MPDYQQERWQYTSWSKGNRIYSLALRQNIFGNWLVQKVWGSNRRRGMGRSQDLTCESFEAAEKIYRQQYKKRIKRGYQIT
jgi:hypothetical protein